MKKVKLNGHASLVEAFLRSREMVRANSRLLAD